MKKNLVKLVPFSDRLSRFLEKVGATQAEAAKAMGVTDTTFQNYLYGKTWPSVEKVEALANHYAYPPKWFFQDDAEIGVEDVKTAVQLIEKTLQAQGKDLETQNKSRAIALTARTVARERELGQKGDLEGKLRRFVEETLSLLQ